MANDKQPQENIERARDLLSPYLDDEISTEERALVEQAIAGSSELRWELETLRQTVSLVAALPPMPAPRPFTLSQADVRPVQPPARRGFFSLPIWVGSAALVAATLICVVAIGGVFFNGLFGAGQLAPASEIALQQDQVASEPAPAEAPAAAESAAKEDPAAEDTFRAEGEPAQEIAPAVEEPAEEESVEMMAEQEAEAGAEKELMAEEEAEALESEAMEAESIEEPSEEAALAQENQASADDEADTMTDGAGEAAAAAPPQPATASPSPPAQATPAPAPTAVMPATSIAEAQAAPATADEAAPPVPPVDRDEALKLPSEIASEPGDSNAARLVEIQDRSLSVTPGLIELTGSIEAEPGSVLVASLRRNGAPFDDWAEPGTLQTVVQPDGRFMFAIQTRSDRLDQNLYSTEPVTYEIIITSISVNEPVTAVVAFDMSAIPTPLATPSATATPVPTSTPPLTSTPRQTATLTARVEPAAPTPTVIPETGQTTAPAPAPASQNRPGRLIITAIALILGLLVIIGLIGFWWIVRKQRG
jgi:chemotaxis protein histidine kinase CheA